MTEELLAGAWQKLDRAGEHVDALEREWSEAVERNREHIIAIQFDPTTGWYESRIARLDLPYLRLAIIGGEIAYQLRSALEHVAQALVLANNAKPHGRTGFPIRIWPPYEDDFRRVAGASALRGVSTAAIHFIGRQQPYVAGSKAAANRHYLATLKSFADTDKHRTLFVVATVPTDVEQFRQLHRVPAAWDLDFRLLVAPGRHLEPGTRVARFRALGLLGESSQREVFLHGDLTLSVEFTDGRPSPAHGGSLRAVRERVVELVRGCEQFL